MYVVQLKQMWITQDLQRVCSKCQKCIDFKEHISDLSILSLCFHYWVTCFKNPIFFKATLKALHSQNITKSRLPQLQLCVPSKCFISYSPSKATFTTDRKKTELSWSFTRVRRNHENKKVIIDSETSMLDRTWLFSPYASCIESI